MENVEGNLLDKKARLYKKRRGVDTAIEPLLIESSTDKSGDVDFTKLTDEEIDWICVCFCQNTEKIWSKTPKKYGPKHRIILHQLKLFCIIKARWIE